MSVDLYLQVSQSGCWILGARVAIEDVEPAGGRSFWVALDGEFCMVGFVRFDLVTLLSDQAIYTAVEWRSSFDQMPDQPVSWLFDLAPRTVGTSTSELVSSVPLAGFQPAESCLPEGIAMCRSEA